MLENRVAYLIGNKAFIIKPENSKLKWFKFIKLNTENNDSGLIKRIVKNVVQQRI
jgi:hypothetical protein